MNLPELDVNLVQDSFIAEAAGGLCAGKRWWDTFGKLGSRVHTVTLKNNETDAEPVTIEIGKQAGEQNLSTRIYGPGFNEKRDSLLDETFQDSLGIRPGDFELRQEDRI